MDARSYRLFNVIIAGITGILFLYAGFFAFRSDGVSCAYKLATGRDCVTCGLTRSFHSFLTGHWQEGMAWNRFGAPLFAFFALQFLGRIILAARSASLPRRMPLWDGAVSAVAFVLSFGPMIAAQ